MSLKTMLLSWDGVDSSQIQGVAINFCFLYFVSFWFHVSRPRAVLNVTRSHVHLLTHTSTGSCSSVSAVGESQSSCCTCTTEFCVGNAISYLIKDAPRPVDRTRPPISLLTSALWTNLFYTWICWTETRTAFDCRVRENYCSVFSTYHYLL